MVSFDTVSSRSNADLCGRLAELLESLGAQVDFQRKPGDDGQVNLVARLGPDGVGGLALAGHTDTVPWDGSMRATVQPERDGRKLYGRGTCDMKGAIAAMVHAAAAVDSSSLKKPLWLAFTFEEEIGCHGAKLLQSLRPIPAEHCIIGEPTGLRPVTMHKGYLIADMRLQGKPCHSSDPDQGASAIRAASRAVDALLRLGEDWRSAPQPESGLSPPWTTVNVGLLEGGSARNVVPEHARFTIEMRPLPGMDVDELLAEVRSVVGLAAETVEGVSWEFEALERDEPFRNELSAPLVSWLVEATGRSIGSVPFYTEAAIFGRMGASPCVCGPGEMAQAHRVDEWVEMDALEAAAQLYRRAIEEFCR
ncbi:MAG: acetylornithine deacetylase [Myxococcota bacterium]|nr:acetylornithine deacetylase [Myxococcota bacterium]